MSPRDLVYVGHMLDMTRKAVTKTARFSPKPYDPAENLRLALIHLIQIIGEAGRQVSQEFSDRHPEIPWADIIGMRHTVAPQGRPRLSGRRRRHRVAGGHRRLAWSCRIARTSGPTDASGSEGVTDDQACRCRTGRIACRALRNWCGRARWVTTSAREAAPKGFYISLAVRRRASGPRRPAHLVQNAGHWGSKSDSKLNTPLRVFDNALLSWRVCRVSTGIDPLLLTRPSVQRWRGQLPDRSLASPQKDWIVGRSRRSRPQTPGCW